ncbi:hypothetical protein FBULB1_1435 [Fusarium bulbicola]|nr:hypothetical protein FBULB1_1435 [Fusarium bulbicola]
MDLDISQSQAEQLDERRRILDQHIDFVQNLDKSDEQQARLEQLRSARQKEPTELLQLSDEQWESFLAIDKDFIGTSEGDGNGISEDEDSGPDPAFLAELAQREENDKKEGRSHEAKNEGDKNEGGKSNERQDDNFETRVAEDKQRQTNEAPTYYSLEDDEAIEGSGPDLRTNCETVARVGSRLYINAYGAPTYRIHRIEYGHDSVHKKSDLVQVQNFDRQLGRHRIDNKYWKYEEDNALCFFAVAFQDEHQEGIEVLNPERKKEERKRRRKAKKKAKTSDDDDTDDDNEDSRALYVLVGWGPPGAKKATAKSWETRSSLYRIYGKKTDERIYKAARTANNRHNSYRPGQPLSRDTTPNLLADYRGSISPPGNPNTQMHPATQFSSRDTTPNLFSEYMRSISPSGNPDTQMHPATQQRGVSVEHDISRFSNKDPTEVLRPSVEHDELRNQPQKQQFTNNQIGELLLEIMQQVRSTKAKQDDIMIRLNEMERRVSTIKAH